MKIKWNGNFQEKLFENLGKASVAVLFSDNCEKYYEK